MADFAKFEEQNREAVYVNVALVRMAQSHPHADDGTARTLLTFDDEQKIVVVGDVGKLVKKRL